MGNLLKKEVGDKLKNKNNPTSVPLNTTDLPHLSTHTPDHSGNVLT